MRMRGLPAAVLLLFVSGCGAAPAVPPSLAGLPLTHALQGDEAVQQIGRLHGKKIPSRDGFVAHYERDGTTAMLYVSRAYLSPLAMWQLSRMVDGIHGKGSNAEGKFTHLGKREQDDVALHSALGLGQVHYFYRSGPTLVWLAADAEVASPALGDTLRQVR